MGKSRNFALTEFFAVAHTGINVLTLIWVALFRIWLSYTRHFLYIFDPQQNSHWTQLMGPSPRRPWSDGISTLSDHETKRREAVWELFHSEVVYLMSHLLVLKEVRSRNLPKIPDNMPRALGHLEADFLRVAVGEMAFSICLFSLPVSGGMHYHRSFSFVVTSYPANYKKLS